MCALVGFFHVKVPLGLQSVGHIVNPKRYMYDLQTRSQIRISNFSKSLLVVGCLRCCTIMFSLIALWYVPVSFAETVKSSAPVFTVVIARLLLNERTKMLVSLSLVPTMVGLALCSAYELDITATGLTASLCAVLFECFQNVCSKRLLSKERIAPHLLQFYTSAAAFVLQLPSFLLLVHFSSLYESIRQDHNLLLAYVLAGISFHLQSLSEYLLLSHISPVTHSVANTAKRALLIWLSVLAFGNQVTPLSWLGTSLVIIGVLMYNKAKTVSEQSQLDDTINSKQRSHLV